MMDSSNSGTLGRIPYEAIMGIIIIFLSGASFYIVTMAAFEEP